ncbi:MAG: hypothetical protein CMH70_05350 [Nitrosomonadaceae bacterium]|nr:hypothetical protein [Nitrosomonadaceae bacterium]
MDVSLSLVILKKRILISSAYSQLFWTKKSQKLRGILYLFYLVRITKVYVVLVYKLKPFDY